MALADRFPGDGPHLERYARVMNAAEINSSFHRAHRRSAYERWAAAVPAGFAFSVKIPKTISHEKRCAGCEREFEQFLEETSGLGRSRLLLLLQLPPKFEFDEERMERFFALCRRDDAPPVVCEPRHASWFTAQADASLKRWRVPRVAADPPRVDGGSVPGGWTSIGYFRMHGAPRVYYSSYSDERVAQLASMMAHVSNETWCIFDNTASGAAAENALRLRMNVLP